MVDQAALAAELGVTQQALLYIRQAPNFPEAERRLEELKAAVTKQFRKLGFKYHPDRNPDDPEATARFKFLNEMVQQVQKWGVQAKPRPMPRPNTSMQVVFHRAGPVSTTAAPTSSSVFQKAYSSTTSNTTTGSYDARRVVFIRV